MCEHRGVEAEVAVKCPGIRIHEKFVRVPASALGWIPRPVNPEAVCGARGDAPDMAVENAKGLLR